MRASGTSRPFRPIVPDELFEINESMAVQMIEIDGFRILVVDDFYQEPDHLRDYLLQCPAPIWKTTPLGRNQLDYWDCRHEHRISSSSYVKAQRCVAALARSYFGTKVIRPINELTSNVLQMKVPRTEKSVSVIHHDGHCLAALVSLNTPTECHGGTGFFRNRFNGVFNLNRLSRLEMRALDQWCGRNGLLEDGRSYFLENWQTWWELEYLAEMRFNRLIVYEGTVFHGAYFDGTAFTQVPRLNHMMFFNDVSLARTAEWLTTSGVN
jgi:hypothetical protein